MKLLVDVARLEAEGAVSPAQAQEIRRIAAAETTALAINVLSTLGVIAVVGGVVALRPDAAAMAVLGLVLAAVGVWLKQTRGASLGFLGAALALIGALLHCGAVVTRYDGSALAFAYATAVFLTFGIFLRQGLLVALALFALAGLFGSSTGYRHAAYSLWVREAAVTIVVFAGLAALAFRVSRHVGAAYRPLARIVALLAIVWINFGFWVGSLWGDRPGASWVRADLIYAGDYDPDRARKLREWHEQALFIPDWVFALAWALGLLSLGIWAASRNERGVLNAVATFAAIHFYTQWFERLRATPEMVIAAGVIAVAIAFALWRYNKKAGSVV